MVDAVENLFVKLLEEDKITYDEFQTLLALREKADDLQDMLEGDHDDYSLPFPNVLSTSPALAIIVGHTEKRPGAKGVHPISSHEYEYNLDLGTKLNSQCQKIGVKSKVFTRDAKGISGAYRNAIKWGATYAVELHFNAFNSMAHGIETLYDRETHKDAETWAALLQERMLLALGLRDRKIKEVDPGGRGYRSLSAASIPIALIEPFFGDNESDAKVGLAKKADLAEAVAKAAQIFIAPTS